MSSSVQKHWFSPSLHNQSDVIDHYVKHGIYYLHVTIARLKFLFSNWICLNRQKMSYHLWEYLCLYQLLQILIETIKLAQISYWFIFPISIKLLPLSKAIATTINYSIWKGLLRIPFLEHFYTFKLNEICVKPSIYFNFSIFF